MRLRGPFHHSLPGWPGAHLKVLAEYECWPQAVGRRKVLCVALIPRPSGKQPYLLILVNKWAAFILSVSGTAENRKIFNNRLDKCTRLHLPGWWFTGER